MFSHSCPSQVHSLLRRPHKEHAQCGLIYYTLQYQPGPCEWEGGGGVGGGGHTKAHAGATGMAFELKRSVSARVDAKR